MMELSFLLLYPKKEKVSCGQRAQKGVLRSVERASAASAGVSAASDVRDPLACCLGGLGSVRVVETLPLEDLTAGRAQSAVRLENTLQHVRSAMRRSARGGTRGHTLSLSLSRDVVKDSVRFLDRRRDWVGFRPANASIPPLALKSRVVRFGLSRVFWNHA